MKPEDMSPEEYGALTAKEKLSIPDRIVKALRRRWGVESRATTPNGAPYPLRSWPPDAAIDIQNLAEWADRILPGGAISLTTAQSIAASPWTKAVFTGATPELRGGLTWDAAQNAFMGPRGLYLVTARVYSGSAAAATVDLSTGTASAATGAGGGGYVPGSVDAPIYLSSYHTNASTSAGIALWVQGGAARNINYKALAVSYIGRY